MSKLLKSDNPQLIANNMSGCFFLKHVHTCHDQRRFCHVSLNVIKIALNIKIKHHIKCKDV